MGWWVGGLVVGGSVGWWVGGSVVVVVVVVVVWCGVVWCVCVLWEACGCVCGGGGGGGGADVQLVRPFCPCPTAHAMNWVASHLGVRLPATPPPLPRPDGGGQTVALCLCTGRASFMPHQAVDTPKDGCHLHDGTRELARPAQQEVDHLANEKLRRLHGLKDHGKPPLRHDREIDELHNLSNRDIDHRVQQQGNSMVQRTVWTTGTGLCTTATKTTTCTACKTGR